MVGLDGRPPQAYALSMATRHPAKPKPAGRNAPTFVPQHRDAKHVRRAFEQDEKHPEQRVMVSPEQLRRWAETGEWPESSG